MKTAAENKKPKIVHRKFVRTKKEKIALALWTSLCVFLVGVFVFMTWFMYNPKNRLAHNLKYGQRYLAQADYPKAVAEFRRVLKMDETNEEAYRGLMEAALQTEDTEAAVSLYCASTVDLKSYKDPLLKLLELRAVERVDEGDYDGAFSVATTVEKTTGDKNAAALIRALVIDGMIDAAKSEKDPDKAIALFRRILEIDDVDKTAVYRLMAKVYEASGRPNEALAILDEGISETEEPTELTETREETAQENAEVFLPDTYLRDLNNAMAATDFEAAAEIATHELFTFRIADYARESEQYGEKAYDFTEIQPADMNTSVYTEHADDGTVLMVIIDWQRTTQREAVFSELVYVPLNGEVLALTQKQKVTDENTLADEGHYYRLADGERTEIDENAYFDDLSAVFAPGFAEQAAVSGQRGDQEQPAEEPASAVGETEVSADEEAGGPAAGPADVTAGEELPSEEEAESGVQEGGIA